MNTIIVKVEKPGSFGPTSDWAVMIPVDESLLNDPLTFGQYVLKAVEQVRSGS